MEIFRPRPFLFQSTPSARRATKRARHDRRLGIISIHALREEGDFLLLMVLTSFMVFQSTPSARRATRAVQRSGGLWLNFNPRPPRGGRRHGTR